MSLFILSSRAYNFFFLYFFYFYPLHNHIYLITSNYKYDNQMKLEKKILNYNSFTWKQHCDFLNCNQFKVLYIIEHFIKIDINRFWKKWISRKGGLVWILSRSKISLGLMTTFLKMSIYKKGIVIVIHKFYINDIRNY